MWGRGPNTLWLCSYPIQFVDRIIIFLHWMVSETLKNQLTIEVGYISGLSVVFHCSICLSLCHYHNCLGYHSFVGSVGLPTLYFSKIILATQGPLYFHMSFEIILSFCAWKRSWNSDRDRIGSLIQVCYCNISFHSMNMRCPSVYLN